MTSPSRKVCRASSSISPAPLHAIIAARICRFAATTSPFLQPPGWVSVLGLEWLRRCRDTHLLNISPAAARSRLAATVCAASPSSSTATVCSMVSTSSEAIGADGGGGGGLLGPPCPGSGSGFGLPPARPGSGGGVRSARIQSTAPPSAAISVVCSLPRHKGWGKVSGAVDLLVAPSLS